MGKQILQLERSDRDIDTETVLLGLSKANLLGFLQLYPLRRLELVRRLEDDEGPFNGDYDRRTRTVRVNLSRSTSDLVKTLHWGKVETVSSVAPSPTLAAQKSLVHEVGHHMLWEAANHTESLTGFSVRVRLEAALQNALEHKQYVSERASVLWSEYFCETHVAYVYHPNQLREKDQMGYTAIKEIRQLLGVQNA